jgi:hypothetical protein
VPDQKVAQDVPPPGTVRREPAKYQQIPRCTGCTSAAKDRKSGSGHLRQYFAGSQQIVQDELFDGKINNCKENCDV